MTDWRKIKLCSLLAENLHNWIWSLTMCHYTDDLSIYRQLQISNGVPQYPSISGTDRKYDLCQKPHPDGRNHYSAEAAPSPGVMFASTR